MKEKDVILNCPFCGEKAHLRSTTFGDSIRYYYRVECNGSKTHALDCWDDTPIEAIETWNERKK